MAKTTTTKGTPIAQVTQVGRVGTDIEATLDARDAIYGGFENVADLSQELKKLLINHEKWEKLPPYAREALGMIQHKISRIVNGDYTYADSWHDIAGYATLVYDQLHKDGIASNC